MSEELTRWFSHDVKPIRVGGYEVAAPWDDFGTSGWVAHWDGHVWRTSQGGVVLDFQDRIWRGLAKEPK